MLANILAENIVVLAQRNIVPHGRLSVNDKEAKSE